MRRLVSFCVAALVSAFVMFATPSEAEATVPLSLGGYAAQLEAPIVGTSPMIQNPVLAQTGAPDLNGLYADQFHRAQTWARIGTYTAFGGLILATVGLFMAIDCIGLFTDDATDSCGAGLGLFWGGSLLALAGSVTVGSAGFRAGRRLSLMGGNGNTVMPIVSLVMVVTALVLPSVVGVGSGLLWVGGITVGALGVGSNNRRYYRAGFGERYGSRPVRFAVAPWVPSSGGGGAALQVVF